MKKLTILKLSTLIVFICNGIALAAGGPGCNQKIIYNGRVTANMELLCAPPYLPEANTTEVLIRNEKWLTGNYDKLSPELREAFSSTLGKEGPVIYSTWNCWLPSDVVHLGKRGCREECWGFFFLNP